MTSKDFVATALNIASLNTAYAKGTFGNKYTIPFIKQKTAQYPSFYTNSELAYLSGKAQNGTLYLFDCCGLIKSIIWNFPDIKYASNGMRDCNDQGIWDEYCINKSTDFNNIIPGEIVHIKGHVGIYVGNYQVVEATNRWSCNVLISTFKYNEGSHNRLWDAHGKLKLLDYGSETEAPEIHITYTVRKGDTLSKIAAIHHMTWEELWKRNPEIKNPNLIYPGQCIIIR